MLTLTTAFSSHLAQEATTLATCWSLTRRDGVSLYFTDHDQDLLVDGQLYRATASMNPSAVTSQAGLSVDNLEFEGMLSSSAIKETDILAGKYDHAEIAVFLVNYSDTAMGRLPLKTGWIGEVTVQGGQFIAEMRGITSRLQQSIGDVYTANCRAALGDARCGVNLASYTFSGSVTGAEGAYAFSDSSKTQANGYFSGGKVTFSSGSNIGIAMEVRDFSAGRFGLFLPLPSPITVGDAYTVHAGCDKRFDTCVARFFNAMNFRGEPHVPGTDKLLETSATRST
jgi:uncharacterized phage protein (TIGR02218 family)